MGRTYTIFNCKGFVLSFSILVIIVISISAGAIALGVYSNYKLMKTEIDYIKASSLADIGIKRALHIINQPHLGQWLPYNENFQFSPDVPSIDLTIVDNTPASDYRITSSCAVGLSSCHIIADAEGSNLLSYKETR